MPSIVVTPAELRWRGSDVAVRPLRVAVIPAQMNWLDKFIGAGPGGGAIARVSVPKLDRLLRQEKIVNPDGTPSPRFQQIWQRTMEAIEQAFFAIDARVTDNTALLQEIRAAQQLAQAASDQARQTARDQALETSYTDPSGVLSAESSGLVTISAHTRVYGDGTRVSVNGGSVSGFASGDYVTVFYEDAARQGGNVQYQASTGLVAQKGATHIVGQVNIPAAGLPPQEGSGPTPPGYTRNQPRMPEE